ALDAQNYHEQAEVAFRRGLDKWQGDPAPTLNNLALNLASQNKLDQSLALLHRAKAESPGWMEIERNIRTIATLKEGADDLLIKQQKEKQKETEKAGKSEEPKKEKTAKPARKPAEKPAEKTPDVKAKPRAEKKGKVQKPVPKPAQNRQNFNQ